MLLRVSIVAIASVLAMSGAGRAQNGDVMPPPDNCRVTPAPQAGNGNDQRQPTQPDPQTTQSLTDKLGPCDGVLKPPAVGDQELTQPPPDTGETLIIRPHDLPGQQSNPDGG
jgi:hypothetical protein